jgi:sulfhydrogenase subunit delta
LSLLDCEEELLSVVGEIDIAYFLEATRVVKEGPYDLSLVEGSITTPEDLERIRHIRDVSKVLISIGACATAGGIQALRNFADVEAFTSTVYAHPEYIDTLDRSTPIADHVFVDFELRGCPINKYQLVEVISAYLAGRKPNIPTHSVCMECKLRGAVCVMVADGIPCLGPVTQAGCGAICPAYRRGCFGCYGPMETPNPPALSQWLRPDNWPCPTTIWCACGGPTTPSPSHSARRVRAMSTLTTKTIKVDNLARVEGEGALTLRIKEGVIEEARLRIFEPPRFFEAFLAGRRYSEAPDITARICGICPVAYQMSSVYAMEDALDVTDRSGPDPRAAPPALLRRMDREPCAARLHAARPRLPRLPGRDPDGRRSSGHRRGRTGTQEDG